MATNSTQMRLEEYGVHTFGRGDLIRETGRGRTTRLQLTECPLCAADPYRPRYHFAEGESRADHFARHHDAAEL